MIYFIPFKYIGIYQTSKKEFIIIDMIECTYIFQKEKSTTLIIKLTKNI